MKTTKNLCLAMLALSLLAIPAAAQKGNRSNKGAVRTADARADFVQSENKDKDKDKDKDNDKGRQNPDRDKAKGKAKAKGETKGKHNGHREH